MSKIKSGVSKGLFFCILGVFSACRHAEDDSGVLAIKGAKNESHCLTKVDDASTIEVYVQRDGAKRTAIVADISPIAAVEPVKFTNVLLVNQGQFNIYSAPGFLLRIAKISPSIPPVYQAELTTKDINGGRTITIQCDESSIQ